ncbi:MAG: hypothetical protein U9O65_01915 [Thermotogota bacterium]|nr:hypothetical protein [Thermotogota bacterium]
MNILIILLGITEIGIGVKIDFVGGPIPSIVFNAKLKDKVSVNFSAGGFPTRMGPIMRMVVNFRYLFKEKEKWSPYVQGGFGYTTIRFNEYGQQQKERTRYDVTGIHFNGGMTWSCLPRLDLSADFGLMYAPHCINPCVKEEFPDVIPIVPMIGLEGVYSIK